MKIEIENSIRDPDFNLSLTRENKNLTLSLTRKNEDFVSISWCFGEDQEYLFDNTKIESISKNILQGIAIDETIRMEGL